jgi:hypothetical protein
VTGEKRVVGIPPLPPLTLADLVPGRMYETKQYGTVVFERWDDYMGQRTAQLRGITYPGGYNPFPEDFLAQVNATRAGSASNVARPTVEETLAQAVENVRPIVERERQAEGWLPDHVANERINAAQLRYSEILQAAREVGHEDATKLPSSMTRLWDAIYGAEPVFAALAGSVPVVSRPESAPEEDARPWLEAGFREGIDAAARVLDRNHVGKWGDEVRKLAPDGQPKMDCRGDVRAAVGQALMHLTPPVTEQGLASAVDFLRHAAYRLDNAPKVSRP